MGQSKAQRNYEDRRMAFMKPSVAGGSPLAEMLRRLTGTDDLLLALQRIAEIQRTTAAGASQPERTKA